MDSREWRSGFAAALVVAGATMAATPAFAGLLGTQVSGVLNFDAETGNFYDPANGFVPAGYGNSTSPNNVVIQPYPNGTFGFKDGANTDVSNFTDTTLTFTDTVTSTDGNVSIQLTFTDTAFAGSTVSLVSNNFTGITESLVGDVLSLSIPAASVTAGEVFSAVYSITTAAVAPEPGSLGLLGAGLAGLAFCWRRRAARD